MSRALRAFVFCAIASVASGARADAILPPPSTSAIDGTLYDLAVGYQRQQDVFAARESGLSIDPFVKPEDMKLVRDFFAQKATDDFQKFSGRHPFDVLERFDEYGDQGNFAGVASVGVAARFIVLKAAGGDAGEIARAKDAAVRAAKAWHVYGAIGGKGIVARGIRKLSPETAGAPSSPGPVPELVPLKDASGPLPTKKGSVFRAPVASGFDGWIWQDDTSKDQLIGYALAVAWLWDALHDDPSVPSSVSQDLASDLAAFAHALMQVAPEREIDLCIRDADGRLTTFSDLNPRQLSPTGVLPEDAILSNGFNAAMALAIVRAAYHVSGDAEIGRYYYEELVGRRDLPLQMSKTAGGLFIGAQTNFSNAGMLAIALATLGRVETDPYVREQLGVTLEKQFWSRPDSRDVSSIGQAWYDAIYGAYADKPPKEIRSRIQTQLSGFQPAPAFNRERVNCDDAEIAAGSCIAIDGTTKITLSKQKGHGGLLVADAVLPMSIRPDSDFEWRADPFEVNGGAGNRMNPGGDYLAAYWFARANDVQPYKNRSPFARSPLPYERPSDGSDAGVTPPGATPESSGCGCRASEGGTYDGALLLTLLGAVAIARRINSRRA